MKEVVRKDILTVLVKSIDALRREDIPELRELSNHTIHDASIYQDENSISIAVILYSLSKIFERLDYRKKKSWGLFHKNIIENLEKCINSLEVRDFKKYDFYIHSILQDINKLSKKLRNYILKIIKDAKIHKASRLHEHGISVGKTAELLGISGFELMEYLGKTGISDATYSKSKDAIKRLNYARSIFS